MFHGVTGLRGLIWIAAAFGAIGVASIVHPTAPWIVAGAIALLFVLAWYRSRRRAANRTTLLLVGNDSELSVIAAYVSGRHIEADGTERSTTTPVFVRAATLDEAAKLISQLKCREVVLGESEHAASVTLVDSRGETPKIVTAREKLAHLFGRVRTDLVITDPWYTRPATPDTRGYLIVKRTLDVVLAIIGMTLLALPALVIALVLSLLGFRSPMTNERRVGRGQRTFALYRFRTEPDAANSASPRGKLAIRTGLVVRRTHLDQIPSLWNVARGDMSLIGPRPERPEDIRRLEALVPIASARTRVRPGLASLAQVRFRYSDSLRDTLLALEYDLYYARYHSAAQDARIFLRASWLLCFDVLCTASTAMHSLFRMAVKSVRQLQRGLPMRPATLASVAMPRADGSADVDHQATLVVGAGSGGRQLVQELRRDRVLGLWPVAFVDDDPAKIGTRVDGLPVLGDTQMMRPIVRREHIDTIVIAIPSAPELVTKRIADEARLTDAQVLTMPDIGTILRGGTTLPLQTVPMTDVLGRPLVEPDAERCRTFLAGKRILITGAAGSIGSELARQVAQSSPAALFGLDLNESDLFDLVHEVSTIAGATILQPIVASVTDHSRIARTLREIRPDVIFHAAAYKHVPLMEEYPAEAIETNTIATYYLARSAAEAGVGRFVLVSTDKAVRPSSVMGATKRLAELAVRAVASETGLSACAVRFGNVLGSRGSVIPLFEKQIAIGGPVTVTHPEMMRYFMTISEAAGLIIEAGALGDDNAIYILDMGDEISIRSLAERLIRLKGLRVGTDITIVYTGIRPGEKLQESLSLEFELASPTDHSKIRKYDEGLNAVERCGGMETTIARLIRVARTGSAADIREAVLNSVSAADGESIDLMDCDAAHPTMDLPPIALSASNLSYGAADD